MPFLILIFINSFYRLTKNKKIISIILLMIPITLLEFLNIKLQIYLYVKWNFGLTILFNTLFVLITLIISQCINVIQMRCECK